MKITPLGLSKICGIIGFPIKQDFDLARAAQADALRQVIEYISGDKMAIYNATARAAIRDNLQSALNKLEGEGK